MRPAWAAALFALAALTLGLALAVYLQAGEATYRDLARGRGELVFPVDGRTLHADEESLVLLHRQTLAYVLDGAAEPATCCGGRPLFSADERSHLADVRGVFRMLRAAAAVAAVVLLALLVRARARRRALQLVRRGALAAGLAVLVLGVVAAVAFEPAFLAFHYLFFPQGNFLFDPATSNLLRLYPHSYWYGVTLRVGATFIAAMAALVALASAAERARGAR